jgi:signal transduction histidine kinase
MSRIVDDLLLLAKSEQPDFIDPHPLDVAEFTRELAAKSAALADRRWAVSETAQAVLVADKQRLTQAIMNLVRNAVEHSQPGTPITIASRVSQGEVSFEVSDQGEGIPQQDQERIFERFSRGRSGQRMSDGAGLGLAIVEAIVLAHDGRIDLRSTPGSGSTFTLTLPAEGPGGERP